VSSQEAKTKICKTTKHDFLAKIKPSRMPDSALGVTGKTIQATQLHMDDFSMSKFSEVQDHSMDVPEEAPDLANFCVVSTTSMQDHQSSFKRAPQLDWEPKPKVIKKVKLDTTTLLVPRMSAKLHAKFDHLPSAGGRIGIQSGVVTPFSTHPLAQIRESPASSSCDTVVAALVASATTEVSLPEPRTAVKRPLDDDPG